MKKKSGGRVAAHEIMRGTSAIRNLIRKEKVAQMYSAIQTGQAIGMQTMDQCPQRLVEKRIITVEAASKKRGSPTAFRSDTYCLLSQVVKIMAAALSSIGLAAKSPSCPDASAAALASRLESRSSTSVTIR